MVEIICKIKPEYQKLIRRTTNRNGRVRKVLVGIVTKAIYGTLLGAVLFYNKLKGVLTDMGFEMNAYDECTFNKMMNGEQIIVQFHVDDLKVLTRNILQWMTFSAISGVNLDKRTN